MQQHAGLGGRWHLPHLRNVSGDAGSLRFAERAFQFPEAPVSTQSHHGCFAAARHKPACPAPALQLLPIRANRASRLPGQQLEPLRQRVCLRHVSCKLPLGCLCKHQQGGQRPRYYLAARSQLLVLRVLRALRCLLPCGGACSCSCSHRCCPPCCCHADARVRVAARTALSTRAPAKQPKCAIRPLPALRVAGEVHMQGQLHMHSPPLPQ